jgi:hypothetical protein
VRFRCSKRWLTNRAQAVSQKICSQSLFVTHMERYIRDWLRWCRKASLNWQDERASATISRRFQTIFQDRKQYLLPERMNRRCEYLLADEILPAQSPI